MTHETELLDDLTDLLKGYDAVRDGAEDSIARDILNLIGTLIRPPDELDFLGDKLGDLESAVEDAVKLNRSMGKTLMELLAGVPGLQ